MSQMFDRGAALDGEIPVYELAEDVRARFIARTYGHLFAAMLGFVALEIVLFKLEIPEKMLAVIPWMGFLGGFMLVSWIASHTAHRAKTLPVQYMALVGYVCAWAFLFAPVLYFANKTQPGVVTNAAGATLTMFAGLTAVVFITRKDFSFLRSTLMFLSFAALAAIIFSLVFSMPLGGWFTIAMIVFCCLAILYDTSNVLHHFPEDRYVGAAVELFGSLAMLLWYVLQFFMSQRD